MSRNESQRKASFSPTQRKACLVLVGCVAAVIISFVASWILPGVLFGSAAGDYDPEAYPVDTTLSAVLTETSDAGADYINAAVFAGDDNVVALTASSSITIDRYVGRDGLAVGDLISDACVYFEDDASSYTIPQAIAKMKPRRVIVMLGANNVDGNTTLDAFTQDYRQALNAIKNAYSYCDIIVSSIPPVAEESDNAAATQTIIDQFNQALAQLCESDGYHFLNAAEALKTGSGFAESAYLDADGTLSTAGVNAYLNYVRTHAYDGEDRRPDTDDIPRRASQAAQAEATPTPTATPQMHNVRYGVQSGSGTLTYGDQSGVSSLNFQVADGETIRVTAVPADGFVFDRWSDGQTSATRVEQVTGDIEVSAIFSDARVALTLDKGDTTITLGESFTINASVTLGGAAADNSLVQWAVNDELQTTAGSFTFTPDQAGTYTIKAGVEINTGRAEATMTLTVNAPATTVNMTVPRSMPAGSTATLYVNVENRNGDTSWACNQLPDWKPTGDSVQFTPPQPGDYTVRATNNDVTAEYTISVTAAATPTPSPSPSPSGEDD